MIDVSKIKKDFPIFNRKINGKPIVYLDSTASSPKPQEVIDAINRYYTKFSVNIFRGVYSLSEEATTAYEKSRETTAAFIGASPSEIVFTRNATESINLVATAWGDANITRNDEIVTTIMEHHANFVPWQQLCLRKSARLTVLDIDAPRHPERSEGSRPTSIHSYGILLRQPADQNDNKSLGNLISKRTKLVAVTHISNVLGIINPVKEIVREVKRANPACLILVDAAQSVPHMNVDVKDLGCDFLVFSGHKMLGPTGIGVLWAREALLESMPPYQTGGEMIQKVALSGTTFKEAPYKFEAGTPHIAGVIGLGAAVDYLSSIGMDSVGEHELRLVKYALSHLGDLGYLRIYGPKKSEQRGGVISFTMDGVHPHDLAQILDRDNICIRSGHHCAMPLHERLGLPATARASFYIYNNEEDVDRLIEGIEKARKVFHGHSISRQHS